MWNLSSLTRDRTHIPCIAKQILNHWTTREVPSWWIFFFLLDTFYLLTLKLVLLVIIGKEYMEIVMSHVMR